MTNENFNPEDYVGKKFKTSAKKTSAHNMSDLQQDKPFKVVKRRQSGGPFSGNDDWIFEQDGEKFEVESKHGKKLLQRKETKEVEE